jgi:hypothetical protein
MILADSNSWNRRQHPRGPAGIIPLREQLTNDRRGNLTLKDLPYFVVSAHLFSGKNHDSPSSTNLRSNAHSEIGRLCRSMGSAGVVAVASIPDK